MITEIDKHTALVLIDLQNAIVRLPLQHPVNEVIKNAATLLHAFHKAALPAVIVNVNPSGRWTSTRKDAKQATVVFTDEQLAITPELSTHADDIFITKRTWNAFFETGLHEALQQRSITNIVLAGIATSVGVEGTARAAAELGYNVSFASDAMADMVLEAHERSLQYLFPRIGEVGTVAEIIEKIPGALN
ncbi:cysteine hydrolase [Mucilaginibacter sp. UR6-1]|uniref:cysteine hydrolase n=1 Tax=Mucilaginibacter sp. UR6-1 TaxID=1435643 RepID=UPI001E64F600|nr:cysteine hydrolase [Mucilaginibacter sp. UR6-1]MCC8410504.1 cysteine hydrolase [Mucilaginibacter sp. UR6-1]